MAAPRTAARACLLILIPVLVLAVQPGRAEAPVAPGVDAAYLVQPGDTLQVTVWKEQELQAEVLVRPDGGLNFPLAGEVPAAGHTVEDIRKTLQARLLKYIPDPVVTVLVKRTDGSRIFVVGKVNHPGDFIMFRPIDVMQALSLAGGATPYADVNGIRILRREGTQQQVFHFRYDDVRRGKDLAQNIFLHSGDTVVVP